MPAQRRAGRYGDAWFPYFVQITPKELADGFDRVRYWATKAGRAESEVHLCCCLPIELTVTPVAQIEGRLKGNATQLVEALKAFEEVGVEHLALQFMTPRWPDRSEQIERFARDILPYLQS